MSKQQQASKSSKARPKARAPAKPSRGRAPARGTSRAQTAKPPKAALPKGVSAQRGIPASYATPMFGSRATFAGGREMITVTHKELLGTLSADVVDWGVRTYATINPGNPNLFPWLSTFSRSWESYHFKALRFHYRTRSSTQRDGVVQLFADYDVSDLSADINATIVNESAASNFLGFVETPPYESVAFTADRKSMDQDKKMKYIVPQAGVPVSADPANYYSGIFLAATAGVTGTLGSIWVEYVVDLYTPTATASDFSPEPNFLSALSESHSCSNDPYGSFTDWFCVTDNSGGDALFQKNMEVEASTGAGGLDTLVFTQPGYYSITWLGELKVDQKDSFDSSTAISANVEENGLMMSVASHEMTLGVSSDSGDASLYNQLAFGLNVIVETISDVVTSPYVNLIMDAVDVIYNHATPASAVLFDRLNYAVGYLGPILALDKKAPLDHLSPPKPRGPVTRRKLVFPEKIPINSDEGLKPETKATWSSLPRQPPNWRSGLPRDAHVRAFEERRKLPVPRTALPDRKYGEDKPLSPKRPKDGSASIAELRTRLAELEVAHTHVDSPESDFVEIPKLPTLKRKL